MICRECENYQKVAENNVVGFVCKASNALVWPTMVKCAIEAVIE